MHIAIKHRTTYSYDEPVTYSAQSLRLTPQSCDAQKVLNWEIEAPGIGGAPSFVDGFGNIVRLITVTEPHDHIEITVAGQVETADTTGVRRGASEVAPVPLFMRNTRLTMPDKAIAALAKAARGKGQVERMHDLMKRIREGVAYQVGETHYTTTAAEALARGAGVCQDHTHIFIAAARSLGIPARYVSGYLWATEGEPLDAQHAWAEAYIEDLGWVGFDVSNGISPDQHYIRVACGLDYDYAAPVRGSRRGGGGESLKVHVEVGAAQAQQ